ncbi:MAG: hypothetical protein AAGA85_16735 [Bacteroidota bacterium]
MDQSKFNEFRGKIEKSLNDMEAKLSFMNDGIKGLAHSHKNFQEEMSDFMSFMAESLSDHEQRIIALEKKIE